MSVVVVVGAQWGDEGKGKIVDLYTRFADVVVRYGGGANAGHTLVVDGDKTVFHLMPSGALHPDKTCVIGQGTVVDPGVLVEELRTLQTRNLLTEGRFLLSDRAHVVLPHHKAVDDVRERGVGAIGTTRRGIGPAYEDKVARRGVRISDLIDPDRCATRVRENIEGWLPWMRGLGAEAPNAQAVTDQFVAFGQQLKPYVADTGIWLGRALKDGKRVLLEGAQGAMLDIDVGSYPFVTSSSVTAGGACAGSGIPPTLVNRVVGIAKAYTTRVGAGPFPTELEDKVGEHLRAEGAEFGATTGRPRRCGWLDIPTLRMAVRANGIQHLALSKLDVMSGLDRLKICTSYELDGSKYDEPPAEGLDRVRPVYEEIAGWSEPVNECREREQLPREARAYVERVEQLLECPVSWISVGPDRQETLNAERDPFAQSV